MPSVPGGRCGECGTPLQQGRDGLREIAQRLKSAGHRAVAFADDNAMEPGVGAERLVGLTGIVTHEIDPLDTHVIIGNCSGGAAVRSQATLTPITNVSVGGWEVTIASEEIAVSTISTPDSIALSTAAIAMPLV